LSLFNLCISFGIVPLSWKQAVTKLFHKKDSTDNPKNFRPISLTSSLCKIFTSLVNLRISHFATSNKNPSKIIC
jgi:hypothetical protein